MTRPPDRPDSEPLPSVPGYRILEVRGAGAFGLVLRARCQRLGREVAIKLLKDLPGTPTARDRFLREARLLVGVREEGLIPILDAELASAHPYLVLPWMAGGDLASRIAAGRPPPPDEVLARGGRRGRAPGALRGGGILHRDIKPANVLLDERGGPWLSDLGLGKGESDATLTGTGHLVGTPRYLAPELLTSGIATPGTDVFALGVTLVELATGRAVPGMAGSDGTLHRILEGVEPPALRRALRELVAMDPADRPADGDAAARTLEGAAGLDAPRPTGATVTAELPALPTSSAPAPAGRGPAPRLPWVGVGLLAAAGILLFRAGPGPDEPPPPSAPRAPWEDPGLGPEFRRALAKIGPSQLASYRDPAAWPDLVARLPGAAEFQAWLAGGGPGSRGLTPDEATLLRGLDDALAALALPAVFGAAVLSRPADRPATIGPVRRVSEFGSREVGGWFATAARAAERVLAFHRTQDELLRRVARGGSVDELSPAMQEVSRSLGGAMRLLADDENFQLHALDILWARPEIRRDISTTHVEALGPIRELVHAIGQSGRHEPATRELLAEWVHEIAPGTLRLAAYSPLAFQDPLAALGGPPDTPAGRWILAQLLFEIAPVRKADPVAHRALVEAAVRAATEALEPLDDADPLRIRRVGRAFASLFRGGNLLVPPDRLLELWRTRVAARPPPPADLVRLVSQEIGIVAFKDQVRGRNVAAFMDELARTAAAADPPVPLDHFFVAARQLLGEPGPTPPPPR